MKASGVSINPAIPVHASGSNSSSLGEGAAKPTEVAAAMMESDESDVASDKSSSTDDDVFREQYFAVKAKERKASDVPSEMDKVRDRCEQLRKLLTERPTLPPKSDGSTMSFTDLKSGAPLPLFWCVFRNGRNGQCSFQTSDRDVFLHHITGGESDDTHRQAIIDICKTDVPWMSRSDYVHVAIAVAEREHWPRLGLSTTRRSLNLVARALTNEKVQCLACFVCGQLRNTIAGLTPFDERIPLGGARKPRHAEISYWDRRKFQQLESTSPGTLLNNCSFDLWRKR